VPSSQVFPDHTSPAFWPFGAVQANTGPKSPRLLVAGDNAALEHVVRHDLVCRVRVRLSERRVRAVKQYGSPLYA
jgi:hypothetical protein